MSTYISRRLEVSTRPVIDVTLLFALTILSEMKDHKLKIFMEENVSYLNRRLEKRSMVALIIVSAMDWKLGCFV